MSEPLALKKETEPVQDAAVPLEEADARFTRLICAVSELASPTTGRFATWVKVVVVVVAS